MIRTIRGIRVMLDRDWQKSMAFQHSASMKRSNATPKAFGVPDGFHVSAQARGVRFLDIAKCDVKNRSRWPAHSPLRVY
jgi:hypothetical protein